MDLANETLFTQLKLLYESILDKVSINVKTCGLLLALLATCKHHLNDILLW